MASFEWFLDGYEEIYGIGTFTKLNEKLKSDIKEVFSEYAFDYKIFLEKIKQLLDLTKEQKNILVKYEKYCIGCNDNYPIICDPFIVYIDSKTNDDITYKLCNNCNKITNCNKCNNKFEEPWEQIYVDLLHKTTTCYYCYNDYVKPLCQVCGGLLDLKIKKNTKRSTNTIFCGGCKDR